EILIFSYNSDTFYKVLSAFGILQTIFWINLSSLSLVEVKSDRDVSFLSEFQQKHKNKLAGGIILLGWGIIFITFLFFSLMYPLRTVKKIALLKNNKEIQLFTYSFFGKTRSLKVNLDDISCKQSREAKGSHLPMKIRGKFFYFLLDKKSGTFHEPKLFDQVVGLNRSL
ncbi:hypothetical protein HELRODRAFT_124858, partial [Helobdella robusta]|uniref:Transmembrane protein 223 n=1 Tax=Helobdella robusta TaxID=6412 RepID=T1EH32_HELRO